MRLVEYVKTHVENDEKDDEKTDNFAVGFKRLLKNGSYIANTVR